MVGREEWYRVPRDDAVLQCGADGFGLYLDSFSTLAFTFPGQ